MHVASVDEHISLLHLILHTLDPPFKPCHTKTFCVHMQNIKVHIRYSAAHFDRRLCFTLPK